MSARLINFYKFKPRAVKSLFFNDPCLASMFVMLGWRDGGPEESSIKLTMLLDKLYKRNHLYYLLFSQFTFSRNLVS